MSELKAIVTTQGRNQSSLPAKELISERNDERIRPSSRSNLPDRREDFVVKLGMSRSKENGQCRRRPRNAGSTMNDETFITMRGCIELEESLDLRHRRSSAVSDRDNVIKP
jgi:hypothetical protein